MRRLLWVLPIALILLIPPLSVSSSQSVVKSITQGNVEVVHVPGALFSLLGLDRDSFRIYLEDEELPVFVRKGKFYVVVGVDVAKETGLYTLKAVSRGENVYLGLRVEPGDFEKVLQHRVYEPATLPPEALATIRENKQPLIQALQRRTKDRLWQSLFDYPLDNMEVTSSFGIIRIYDDSSVVQHRGLDLRGDSTTTVKAPAEGIVSFASTEPLHFEGNIVVLDHGQGITSLYMHLSSVSVKTGDRVGQGQVIGKVGATGLATGPHLHFEIRINGASVNPLKFIQEFRKLAGK